MCIRDSIDSASAKIMQKTQDEKAKYADYISKEKQAFDQNLEDQVNAQVNEYEKTLAKESEKEIAKYQMCIRDSDNRCCYYNRSIIKYKIKNIIHGLSS